MNMHSIADRGVRHRGSVSQTPREKAEPEGRPGPPGQGGDRGPEGTSLAHALAAYEERLHAVRSGLAAVSAAVHVLSTPSAVTGPTLRLKLGSLLIEELERLQRLVSLGDLIPIGENDSLNLDDVLESVTLARHLVNQEVHWLPSGCRIVGTRDVVVELLNILLVNAARHAPSAPVRIEVEPKHSMVKVSVIDGGPGVPEELKHVLFERGARREGSTGQGIGLAMARELATGLGGSLDLDRTQETGARFDLILPTADPGGAS
jgi:signal transduction histidine kinase